ncbi:hypothetical protein OH76DRAFT_889270 [Lentinus brumalis]|uniref:Uncharacterized protein n=1 Tax=Lentinus brumalis TaxID=2498619 RepID=A0A371D1G8_9APHY|nr:hypothetical protein OH76DRAFT_889270 [Polyporus brumalis]
MSIPTRLLDTSTGNFVDLTWHSHLSADQQLDNHADHVPPSPPPSSPGRPSYAILSHVWNAEGEQSYTDLREIQASLRSPPEPINGRSVRKLLQLLRKRATDPRLPHNDAELTSCLDHPKLSEKIRRACASSCSRSRISVHLDRLVLHRQDKQRGAVRSQQLHVHLVPKRGCL